MEHRTIETLAAIAAIHPVKQPSMSRRQRLKRWLEILDADPGRLLRALEPIEDMSGPQRRQARADNSALALAFADPVLRGEGLSGDTVGHIEAFFGLRPWQTHYTLCVCHFGGSASAGQIAERISAVACRPTLGERWSRFCGAIARVMPHAAAVLCVAVLAGGGMAFGAESKSAKEFVLDAIKGDNAEIEMGQLAQQKGSSEQVKDFGRTLATDHETAKNEMTNLAGELGVKVPTGVKPESKTLHARLSKLSGAQFDREFAQAMVKDHEKDIAEFQAEAKAKNGPASDVAAKQLPVLEKHLDAARSLQTNETSK